MTRGRPKKRRQILNDYEKIMQNCLNQITATVQFQTEKELEKAGDPPTVTFAVKIPLQWWLDLAAIKKSGIKVRNLDVVSQGIQAIKALVEKERRKKENSDYLYKRTQKALQSAQDLTSVQFRRKY